MPLKNTSIFTTPTSQGNKSGGMGNRGGSIPSARNKIKVKLGAINPIGITEARACAMLIGSALRILPINQNSTQYTRPLKHEAHIRQPIMESNAKLDSSPASCFEKFIRTDAMESTKAHATNPKYRRRISSRLRLSIAHQLQKHLHQLEGLLQRSFEIRLHHQTTH